MNPMSFVASGAEDTLPAAAAAGSLAARVLRGSGCKAAYH
jgi:hypothetical protein